jgi:pSer/pThr/pTyr-binding forkhead associated (FHA) protein
MDRIPMLVAVEGALKGKRFEIRSGEGSVIGRAPECDISIPDPDVSRQHARVILHNAGVWVQDNNSRNGVFVNEKRVVRRPHELRAGGEITIGEHKFVLEIVEEENESSVVQDVFKVSTEPVSKMWIILLAMLLIVIAVAWVLI